MTETLCALKPKRRTLILLSLPLLLHLLLNFFPELDVEAWNVSWYKGYMGLVQYYFGLVVSIMALITALLIHSTANEARTTRSVFLTLGFMALSSLIFVSSMSIPDLVFSHLTDHLSVWTLRLSLVVSSLFFVLSSIRWPATAETWIISHYRRLWIGIALISLSCLLLFRLLPPLLPWLDKVDSILKLFLAVPGILGFAWTIWQTAVFSLKQGSNVDWKLTIAFVLLVEGQLSLTFGTVGSFSWLSHQPLVFAGTTMALLAILSKLKSAQDIQVARYFALLGSIVIIALSLLSVEVAIEFMPKESNVTRSLLMPLMLFQSIASFIVLFLIVLYLNRLINQRTEALRREQHQRAELTQLIVHDLKSPLTVILGGMNLLGKESLGQLTETQRRLLVNLEQSGYGVLQMINDLLDVERMEEGVLNIQKRLLDPVRLLQEQVNELQVLASTHKQTLILLHPAITPTIRGDKQLLRRVITNLTSNALKFTPEHGNIRITVTPVEEWLEICVEDSGPGVPKEDRERIFEKFAQSKGHERRGAGLGLTFCKMMIEAHDGRLTVGESEYGGALFRIQLPTTPEPVFEDTFPHDVKDLTLEAL